MEATSPASPDPSRLEAIGFPSPWPARPWIYANVIASADGVVTWRRSGAGDDPVRAIAGGDFTRPGRRADLWLMRQLRASADAVAFGAQTLRDQPDLVGAVDDVGGELGAALRRFREREGRRRWPLHVLYSGAGELDLAVPMFNTPGLTTMVVTTAAGARVLRDRGSEARGVLLLTAGEDRIDAPALVRAHERLLGEHDVRHLDCEGGMVALEALHAAGILDELFVTRTEVQIDPGAHVGVRRLFPLDDGSATLVGEGRTAADPGYRFERWRFNRR